MTSEQEKFEAAAMATASGSRPGTLRVALAASLAIGALEKRIDYLADEVEALKAQAPDLGLNGGGDSV